MDFEAIAALFFGIGMFWLGWWVHGVTHPVREVEVARPQYGRWRCPACERVKELPLELASKVLVCNNCNVKLEHLD